MTSIDIRLKTGEVAILRELIGKEFISLSHEELIYDTSVFGVVEILAENMEFCFYSVLQPLDYYGDDEEVAVWEIRKEKGLYYAGFPMVTTPVHEVIKSVTLVQENQRVYDEHHVQLYDNWVTRGVIFNFAERQIALEKEIWFAEEFIIHKGYNLIEKFRPTSDFCEDWEDGWTAECERGLVELT